jgi:ubiquinone/menaquinone biosynthesis C-methylase UbiE
MTSHSHGHHDSIAELLDLDAQVLHRYLFDVMTWVQARATGRPTRRILDVGAGTGTDTVALANHFTSADVVAVDMSAEMLHRVRDRAAVGGLAGRVSTVQMDLDGSWPELGSFDVVWASAALHEVGDPERTFSNLLRVLNPGGLIVVVEMDAPPRFLEDEVSDGLEARIHDVLREVRPGSNDHPDWSANLEHAGFTSIETATFSINLAIDGDGTGGLYAQTYLRRIQPAVAPHLSASDRTMLDALVADSGPLSLRHRDDLHLRAGRTAWGALRP